MSYNMPPSSGSVARRSSPLFATDDSLMEQEKAAVKRTLAQDALFRAEKEGIVAAMGASPSVLLTPSANPSIQRKAGAYTSSRLALLNAFALEDTSNTSMPSILVRDDMPAALDHSDEQEQYRNEEQQELPRKHNTQLYWIIGGVAILAIIGAVVGVVIALTGGNSTATADGDSNSNQSANLRCTWDPASVCTTGSMAIPTCAVPAYNAIMDTAISIEVWAEDSSCSPANFGAVALAVAQTNYNEKLRKPEIYFALAAFYFAADGPSWRFDTLWLKGSSPCLWFGVECYSDGNIVAIELPGNNLKGSLASQIGTLSNLQTLSLDQSLLSGTVPSEIGMLRNLWHLSLFDSFVYGHFPTEIGNCKQLERLDIGSTMLTGTIPSEIGTLEQLTALRLAFNSRLTGTLPTELGNLSRLEYLDLDGMRDITGTIPNATEWGQLTNLRQLALLVPSFDPSPFPDYLMEVTTLEELSISSSHVTGTIPTTIGDMTNLRDLLFEFNDMTFGTLPTEVGLLTGLTRLQLQDSALDGQVPSELGHLTRMSHLSLAGNQLSGTVPTDLGNMVLLGKLLLNDNRLQGTIPTGMCEISGLKVFHFDRCGYILESLSLCLKSPCADKPAEWGEYRI